MGLIDKLYDLSDKFDEFIERKAKRMAMTKAKKKQLTKMRRWVREYRAAGIESIIPQVEGLVYDSKGNISKESDDAALFALENILGSTAKKWIKTHPDEYNRIQAEKRRAEAQKKWDDEVKRAKAIKADRDKAFEEFLEWYGDPKGPRAIKVSNRMSEDPEFKQLLTDLGKGYRYGTYWGGDIREKTQEILDNWPE